MPALTPAVEAALRAIDPGARPSAATRLGAGYANTGYRVPAGTGADWVLRLPHPTAHWAIPDLERETRLLAALDGTLAPLVEPIILPREARLLRHRGATVGALHRMVHGTPLAAVRPRTRATTLADEVARFLARLHRLPARHARECGIPARDLWRDEYEPLIEAARPLLGPASRAWLDAEAAAFVAGGGTRLARRVLVHGDISGDHLLLDGSGHLAGVIDWGAARISDPAIDLAGVEWAASPAFARRVIARYRAERGPWDDDAPRRIRAYLRLVPLYAVVQGGEAMGADERRAGLRRIAAMAARATRGR